MLALAHRLEDMIRGGEVDSYADLAELGHVCPGRITQVMTLLNLAPDIQEEVLFLPRTEQGRDPILERHLREIARVVGWRKQRRLWKELVSFASRGPQKSLDRFGGMASSGGSLT